LIRDEEHIFRDHDYIETVEGWIFCVVSDSHPPGRILAYLKYVPGEGMWYRNGVKFARMIRSYSMEQIKNTISYVRDRRPDYIYLDPTTMEEFTYPPIPTIVRHYKAEERLRQIMERPRWRREYDCERIALQLSEGDKALLNSMGVSGSLLPGLIYENADVDLLVYGRDNYLRVLELSSETQSKHDVERLEKIWLSSFMERYRIAKDDALRFFKRVRNRGFHEGVPYSVHAVRKIGEISERYGDRIYRPMGVARTTLRILDVSDSYFMPSVYRVEGRVAGVDVETLTCYDSTFAGLLEEGDEVEVFGKLEKVKIMENDREYLNMLVGSISLGGLEYIRLLGSS
jgi:predicted nucleotidyltransferase